MKKRTRNLLIVLAIVLAAVLLPRLCCPAENSQPIHSDASQQALPDLPLIEETGEDAPTEPPADLPLLPEEAEGTPAPKEEPEEAVSAAIDEAGEYTSRDDVALYLHTYGRLPGNFITKKQAQSLGWPGGGLDDYAYGKCIGGDRFGNYEGLLPEQKGRQYYECDIDTQHKSKRGAKRIIYSGDGLIYYTADHYETFTLLYGEE